MQRRVVDALHQALLDEHGGLSGLRNEGLLESALARPRQIYRYERRGILELAAVYVAAIVRNHPFVDGNTRTGFMTGYVFLVRNGWKLTASEAAAAQAVLELAAGRIDEEGFAAWLRDNAKKQGRGSRRP